MEGIVFGLNYDVFDVADVAYQDVGLYRVVYFVEIGGYSPFQVFSFAHVDNLPLFVEILIHSRRGGDER